MDILVEAHSGIRWLVLLALLAVAVVGFIRASSTDSPDDRWLLWTSILFDVQVTIGIILYLANRGWEQEGVIPVIHPLAMLAAVAVFHIGLARGRREGGGRGWRTVAVMTMASLVIVLAAIPW